MNLPINLLRRLPPSVKSAIRNRFELNYLPSYSQYGEDVLVEPFLREIETGFYVDIGAHHPTRFSNTHRFHRRGWRGINIDAAADAIAHFNSHRPKDINLQVGIGREPGLLKFYAFDEPAVSTFSESSARRNIEEKNYRLIREEEIQVLTLASVLDMHLPDGQTIHLMSIDVEGLEADVLDSNNWEKYTPLVLLVELNNADIAEALGCRTTQTLSAKGYTLSAKSFNTLLYTHVARRAS